MGLRARLFRHAQRLSLAYHDRRGTTDSLYRIQYDTQSIRSIAVDGLIPIAAAAMKLVGMIYVTAQINPELALIALLVAPAIVILTRRYRHPLRNRYRRLKRLQSGALGVVQESLAALRVVKAFSQEAREEQRLSDRL